MKRFILILLVVTGAAVAQITLSRPGSLYVAPPNCRIVTGTTATDVTFSPAWTTAPKCVCSYSEPGAAPDAEELICVASTTTLDVDVTGGGDPGFDADFICALNCGN